MTRYTRLAITLVALLYAAPAAAQPTPEPAPDDDAASHPATEAEPSAAAAETAALRRRVEALESKLEQMTDKIEESELEKLLKEAEAEAKAPKEESGTKERKFLWGALALQKLNPEISVAADILAQLVIDGDDFYAGRDDRSSMPIRELSLHLQHVLDPYSIFKTSLVFAPWPDAEAEVEEVYVMWSGLVPSLSLTVGRFRQEFGVINRWHEHDLDQTRYPAAMELTLGHDGLTGNGVSVKWFMPPLWAHANELTVQITDGENEALFAGEYFSVPSALVHLKNYYDLSESTYIELGLTGLFGVNNRRGYIPPGGDTLIDEPWRRTIAFGADLTLRWSPPRQAKYRSLTWRTEYYYVNKETPEDLIDGVRHSWGVYSYINYQLGTRWFAGVRGDAALPTVRRPFEDDAIFWDVVPYVTFWQSEFVYLRLEYQHARNQPHVSADGALARRTDNRVLLQIDFAAGPHKHEKY